FAQKSADGHDSELTRPIDGALVLVSTSIMGLSVVLWFLIVANLTRDFVFVVVRCRYLNSNQLTGTIPSTIGQLNALRQL
ncbi:hypothetical protein U2088_15355, partial [Listeria monocytogenes]|uniref:hypothetical protein n=1 Tax=Listeria monocytogenes TaxID=1639 RepID=UPI002FDBA6C0